MYIDAEVNDVIRLDQFLKWVGAADTGGMAKALIQNGKVLVNGNLETRRGKKLSHGDLVQVLNSLVYRVVIKNFNNNS